MEQKDFRKITVLELSKKSYISRRTFYRHFNTTLDLINYFIKLLSLEFREVFKNNYERDFKYIFLEFFNFWNTGIDTLLLFKKNDLLAYFMNRFSLELKIEDSKEGSRSPIENYSAYFIIGGSWVVLWKWLKNEAKDSPKELAQIVAVIANNFTKM